MIELFFPNPKNKPRVVYTPYQSEETIQAGRKKVSVDEYRRRSTVVADLVAKSKIFTFREYFPVNKADFEKYGKCHVQAICYSYKQMGDDEQWPDNNNPYLADVKSSKTEEIFRCTLNWLTTEEPNDANAC